MVAFLVRCIWELDGFPGLIEKLSEKQLDKIAREVVSARKSALENDNSELVLDTVDTSTLRDLCATVVDVLDDYGDLEIIMVIDKDAAHGLLDTI